jgi:anti-sigma-K factor RskA
MDDREFQDAIARVSEDHKRFMALLERMSPLTEEQQRKLTEVVAREKRDYDELLKQDAQIKSKGEIAQRAWKAARQATREVDPDDKQEGQWSGWRTMVIALIAVGAILVFLKLVLHR